MLDLNLKDQDILIVQYSDGRTRILTPRRKLFVKDAPFDLVTGYQADRIVFLGADGSSSVLLDKTDRVRVLLEPLDKPNRRDNL